MAWTEEMITTLKALWDQGVSTGEIGKRLGVTKNSVVGKVHRLGLDGRPSPIKRKDGQPLVRKAKEEKNNKKTQKETKKAEKVEKAAEDKKASKQKQASAKKETKAIVEVKEVKKIEHFVDEVNIVEVKRERRDVAPTKEGNCSLTELSLNSCRWPIGDPKDDNFHFCGKRTRVGQTYCDEHSSIAYVKILKK